VPARGNREAPPARLSGSWGRTLRSPLLVSPTAQAGTQALSCWFRHAEAREQAEGRVGAGLVRRWRRGILAYCAQPPRGTSSVRDGVHTPIKHLKRVSYGFRNRDRYRRKMLLGFLPPRRPPLLTESPLPIDRGG